MQLQERGWAGPAHSRVDPPTTQGSAHCPHPGLRCLTTPHPGPFSHVDPGWAPASHLHSIIPAYPSPTHNPTHRCLALLPQGERGVGWGRVGQHPSLVQACPPHPAAALECPPVLRTRAMRGPAHFTAGQAKAEALGRPS